MALTEYVKMPGADYQAACDAIRAKTGKTDLIKSGGLAEAVEAVARSAGKNPIRQFAATVGFDRSMYTQNQIRQFAATVGASVTVERNVEE